MTKEIRVVEGEVRRDIYGSWADCSPGLYIDSDMISEVFADYTGKKIRVTIEEIAATAGGAHDS